MRRTVTLIGFGISVLSFYLVFRKIQIQKITSSIKGAEYSFLLPAFGFVMIGWLIGSLRWKVLINSKQVPFGSVFSALTLGLMANNILSARAGEIIRTYMLGRKGNISRSESFGTVMIDRIMDLAVLLVVLLLALLFLNLPAWTSKLALLAGLMLLIAIFSVYSFSRKNSSKIATKFLSPLIPKKFRESFSKQLENLNLGLRSLETLRRVTITFLLSFTLWFSMSFGLYFTLRAFHITIPFRGIPFMIGILNLGVLIPSSPGYIGTYQLLAVAGLSVFAIEKNTALSLSFASQALWYIPYTLTGLYFLFKENLHLLQLAKLR